MRRDKTLKICANFLGANEPSRAPAAREVVSQPSQSLTKSAPPSWTVLPGVKLAEHAGSDKSVVFTCMDFSEESSGKQEKFCLRFGTIESAF